MDPARTPAEAARDAAGGIAPRPPGGGAGSGGGAGDEAGASAKSTSGQSTAKLDIKGIEGRITVDAHATLEVQLLTYRVLEQVAGRIVDRAVDARAGKLIVLCAPDDLALLPEGMLIAESVPTLTRSLSSALGIQPAPSSGGARQAAVANLIAPGVVGAINTIAGLAGLFRTDVQVQGLQVTPPPIALLASFAQPFKEHDVALLTPETAFLTEEGQALLHDLEALSAHRETARDRLSRMEATHPLRAELRSLIEIADAVPTRAPAGSKTPAIRMAAACRLLLQEKATLLVCSVIAAGGANVVRRTFWSGKVRHVGGCAVSWILIGSRGALLASGIDDGIRRGRMSETGLQFY